MGFETSLNYR